MDTENISKEDFNTSSRGGGKNSFTPEFEEDLKNTLLEKKGLCFSIPLKKQLAFFIGTSKTPSKSLNVRARAIVQAVFNLKDDLGRVSIDRKADKLKFDLTNIA